MKKTTTPKVTDNVSESDGVTLKELIITIDSLYRSLLTNGYKLNEIENMDIFYFLHLMDMDEPEVTEKLTPIEDLNW